MPTGRIDPRYGDASATAPAWRDVERLLTEAQLYWIVTVRRDGRPHTVPLVGVWRDDAFFFCTGPQEQKQRNLDTNPQVCVTTGTTGAGGWHSGTEAVLEGAVERVTDAGALHDLAQAWLDKYGEDWHYEVRDEAFVEVERPGADSHGSAWVYRVRPTKALLFGDPHGQTAYRF